MFSDKPTTYNQSFWVICFLNSQVGIWVGFYAIISQQLRAMGIDYRDQAMMSTIIWPASGKILIAPFVDTYYSKKLGKCKTWLLGGALANVVLLLLLYSRLDFMIEEKMFKGIWC